MLQNLVNHIVFVVDESGSMADLANDVVKVFDGQIQYLATRSQEVSQETRASVYLFNSDVRCLIYDMDVMRLPSLRGHYRPDHMTALIDATLKAVADLEKTPELYGDHAFLIYVLTDGMNNIHNELAPTLAAKLRGLPENWTLAVLVPDQVCAHEAKKFGFAPDNISVWSVTKQGLTEVSEVITRTANDFLRGRAVGVRGTKNLFTLDTSKLTTTTVKRALTELHPEDYDLFEVRKDSVIADFVAKWVGQYVKGSAYYQLTKPETVQFHKQVCVQNKRTGRVYSGAQARQILNLPGHEVRVSPVQHGDFDIFVQSTSMNRKLVGGTKLLVLRG